MMAAYSLVTVIHAAALLQPLQQHHHVQQGKVEVTS
jgi:hypothetical protein